MNKLPPIYRTCIVSREKLLKEDLFRIVLIDGKVVFDKEYKLGGRGVYIKKDLATIRKGCAKHSLSRIFKIDVAEDIYLELITQLAKERR